MYAPAARGRAVALPSSTVDWTLSDGVKEIPIEERVPIRAHLDLIKSLAKADDAGEQLLLAKATGNYKQGNER